MGHIFSYPVFNESEKRGKMKPREIIIILIALLAVIAALWSWYHPKESVGLAVWRDVTHEVTKYITQKVPVRVNNCTVQAIPSQNAQEGPEVTIAEGKVKPSTGGFELKSTISPSTGEGKIYAMPIRESLFGFEDEKHVKIISNGNGGFLNAGWTFARVGIFRVSVEGMMWDVPLKGSGVYVGIGLEARF
jgi:hypothetical protein